MFVVVCLPDVAQIFKEAMDRVPGSYVSISSEGFLPSVVPHSWCLEEDEIHVSELRLLPRGA